MVFYFICCFIEQNLAFGPIQCRISESLTLLPLLFPEAIIGVTLGCLLFNISTGIIYDIIFGTLCTFIGCLLTYFVGVFIKKDWLKIIFGGIPPVLINAIIIPFVLIYGYQINNGYVFLFLTIFIGETISVYFIGTLIFFPIKKNLIKFNIIKTKEE